MAAGGRVNSYATDTADCRRVLAGDLGEDRVAALPLALAWRDLAAETRWGRPPDLFASQSAVCAQTNFCALLPRITPMWPPGATSKRLSVVFTRSMMRCAVAPTPVRPSRRRTPAWMT